MFPFSLLSIEASPAKSHCLHKTPSVPLYSAFFLSCLFVVLYSGHQIGAYFEILTRSLPKLKRMDAYKTTSNYN
jgi:hypothetical protein